MCVCVLVFMCVKGVHTGAWCSQDALRMVSLPLEGPNKGFRHRAPTKCSGLGHKGHKNTLVITHSVRVRGYGCLRVSKSVK